MKIGGISILLITGILNGLLVLFQAGSGLGYVKVSFGVHRKTGIALCFTAMIHAFLAIFAHS
ncbi:MAG: hypothetical protein JRI61_01415 [Deltaproteobacteria bacterium]|nr:hypothetical protein [Deltaproteobacteria bacterium]